MGDSEGRRRVWRRRHSLPVRIFHWTTALCLVVLFMSGLQIFNAHPALYWGEDSHFDTPLFAIDTVINEDGRWGGRTRLLGWEWDTTGVLGSTHSGLGQAFPPSATLPANRSLPGGRDWHFFFAWILVFALGLYLVHGLTSRHIARNIVPTKGDVGGLLRSVRDHFRLHPREPRRGRYNALQKLSYALVLLILLPLMILTGLAMGPAINAAIPGLTEVFGGRQSARTIHFVCAWLLAGFVVLHIVMVMFHRPLASLWSMISGWRKDEPEKEDRPDAR